MKLIMIIVQDQDSYTLVDDLLEEGYRIAPVPHSSPPYRRGGGSRPHTPSSCASCISRFDICILQSRISDED